MASQQATNGGEPDAKRPKKHTHRCHLVEGVLYPYCIQKEPLDELRSKFKTRETDVFVLTYPKTGTTLTQQIVHLLVNNGEQGDKTMQDTVPWLETGYCGGKFTLEELEAKPDPRYFKSHASPHLFPGDWRLPKLIFVTRNPKDTMASLFHHMRSKEGFQYDGDWPDFFQKVLDKDVESSCFFDWTLGWYDRIKAGDIKSSLWLHFEDMLSDLPGAVRKIADFVGIDASDELVQTVASKASFDSMRKDPKANCQWIKTKEGQPGHLRKGRVGDWKNHFTVAQNEVYNKVIEDRLKDTDLTFTYEE